MMQQQTFIEVLANDRGSVEAVLCAISELIDELRSGRSEDWQNTTLEQFLDSMRAWIEAVGPRVGDNLSWKFVEMMVQAAKIYE